MPYIFDDSGFNIVPTGSIGLAFASEGEPVPEEVTIIVTDSDENETEFESVS